MYLFLYSITLMYRGMNIAQCTCFAHCIVCLIKYCKRYVKQQAALITFINININITFINIKQKELSQMIHDVQIYIFWLKNQEAKRWLLLNKLRLKMLCPRIYCTV